MSRQVPALRMSHIIASDAPISSPISESAPWDAQSLFSPTLDSFSLPPYHSIPHQAMHSVPQPPSPPLSVRSMTSNTSSNTSCIASPMPMLKSRLSPVADPEQQLCVPTHQLFGPDSYVVPPLPSPSPEPVEDGPPPVVPSKRPSPSAGSGAPGSTSGTASASASISKKARSGDRITTKDFIPPDVSGLSKREARLVKNRAAAFLSRQRKREEFENMELSVFFFLMYTSIISIKRTSYSVAICHFPTPFLAPLTCFIQTRCRARTGECTSPRARLSSACSIWRG